MANNNYSIAEAGKKTRFSSTNQPKNPGRKKNRFKFLKDKYELSNQDVKDIFEYLLSLKPEEVKELVSKKDTPVIVLTYAMAIVDAIKHKRTYQINEMLDRLHGKANSNVNVDINSFSEWVKAMSEEEKSES